MFLILLSVSGCFTKYQTMADVSPAHKQAFANVEAYYLGKGKEQAAFSLSCSSEQVTATVVSTKPSRIDMQDSSQKWVFVIEGTMITTIGAEGCGRRSTYQVVCGPHQNYGSISGASGMYPPCDVIASSEAAHVVQQNNLEQEQLDEEARRRAAQQQQKSK
jgi:hypothetical protein